MTWTGEFFDGIRLYCNWEFGRQAAIRKPAQTDLANDVVYENASNLALVINELFHHPGARKDFMTRLQRLYPGLVNLTTRISGGAVQLFVEEEDLTQPIPASRLSDGTLRYIFLLAILCHPSPPPVICIEEPEIGLHPDMIAEVGQPGTSWEELPRRSSTAAHRNVASFNWLLGPHSF
ncbi:MAG: AAA family ATPase [Bradymonadaceae bacterium]